MADEFDYIIVGAGSAGCVLANRLSEDPEARILVLEYGGSDRSIFIQMPTALSIPMNTNRFAWQFHTEPEPYLDNRRMHCPRGKVLGGSSSINGMVYVRGHAADYDEWAESGATGWDYQHCLPYFRKADDWKYGGDDYRQQGGLLSVCNGNEMQNPLYQAFIDAGVQAGYARTDDYNGYRQEGFGPMHMTVKNGVRWSTANAYLKPVLHRSNLTVITGALSQRILLDERRATGVEFGVRTTRALWRSAALIAGALLAAGFLIILPIAVIAGQSGAGAVLLDFFRFPFARVESGPGGGGRVVVRDARYSRESDGFASFGVPLRAGRPDLTAVECPDR